MIPASKLHPPTCDARLVRRSRVIGLLTQPGAVRLTLIRGPAGFGKTTVMAQSHRALRDAGIATAWLTVDAADNDASRFLVGLHAAINELDPGDHATAAQLSTKSPGDAVFAVIEQLAAIDHPFVLFIDELEAVHLPAPLAILGQLIERLPRGGRIVVGTRTPPELRLARLRATEQLLEVDVRDLRFSLDETRAFFDRRQVGGLSAGDIALLHDKTEGWPAALWLARLALERIDRKREFIAAFSGTDAGLADYLAEEVLSQQTGRVQRFLLRTSILAEMSPPLCRALVPDEDVDAILDELVERDVVLVALGPQGRAWRYHNLVAGFLRAELERQHPADVPTLHSAAAEAYQFQGRPVPAIEHLLLGGHTGAAVRLMETQAIDMLMQGRLAMLARWFEALPAAALASSPMLQVAQTWTISYTKGPQATRVLLERMASAAMDDPEILAHVTSIRCSMLVQMDRWNEAYAEGRKWLSSLPSASRFADAALVNSTATAAAVLGLFEEARRLVARSRELEAASQFHRMFSESVEGMVDLLSGRVLQAQARFRLALKTSRTVSAHAGYGNAWAGLLYAASVYEAGDLPQAKQLLHIYLPFARDAWLPDHTIIGLRLLARIAFHDGDIDEAFERISELEYLGHERHLPRFVAAAQLERAWVHLRRGHTGAARAELSLAAESVRWSEIDARRNLAHDWDDLDIARVRWNLLSGHAAVARDCARALLDQARSRDLGRRAFKLRLLHAMSCAQFGEAEAAMRMVTELLRDCAGEGVIRMFADEGPMAASLLAQVRNRGLASDPLVADFLDRLLSYFGALSASQEGSAAAGQGAAPQEPLTIKELRLLQLLSEGYSNKVLSEKLFVSDSTVRTHLRNINAKLGAVSRTQAVAIARRFGLVR